MPTNLPKLVLTGENATVTIFVGGAPVPNAAALTKSYEVNEVATQYRDKYLGRTRDRTDKKTTGFDAKLEVDYADGVLFAQLLSIQTARESNAVLIPDLTIGLALALRDGTAQGYALTQCTSKVGVAVKGKDDRITYSLDIQAEDFVPIGL